MLVNMLSAAEPSLAGLSVSAREVVLALKKRGEARASEIAEALGITPSGVFDRTSASATLFTVPSPPAATTTSAP